jgi:hypothetical protein
MSSGRTDLRELSAIRARLADAKTPLEIKRCHFQLHAVLQTHPESVEARRLLKKVARLLEEFASPAEPPAATADPLGAPRSPFRLLPWVTALTIGGYMLLRVIG